MTFNRMLNASFKQVQLLPALSSNAAPAASATSHLQIKWPTRKTTEPRERRDAPSNDTRLPMPRPALSPGERLLMVLLTLNAAVCLWQAFAGLGSTPGRLAGLEQWIAHLLT